jgi:nucleotide-binding universal stress UspA family protein
MDATPKPFKWLVGLDLRPRSQGAVRYAAWIARSSKQQPERLVGVHVLEEAHLLMALRYHHLDELERTAREAAAKMLQDNGAADVFAEVSVVEGRAAEESLEAARTYHHADALVIGRYATREGRHLVRLGRVARRLLRKASGPVVVVPPDLDPAQIGGGPIVVATDMAPDAASALRFGAMMAARLSRPLVAVHVVPTPDDWGEHYLPPESVAKMHREHVEVGTKELARWCTEHGHAKVEQVVLHGAIVEQLDDFLDARKAALLCVGSRHLSLGERLLITSIGSELAAVAPCAVAIVPP